jgi:hypothetical protein
VGQGEPITAVPSELTLLEQGLAALEATGDNRSWQRRFLLMIAIFVQCLEIFEDDLQSADNVP